MKYSLLFLLLLGLAACYEEPEFPTVPSIEFEGVSFVDAPATPPPGQNIVPKDTLKFTISYQDGDGNLGLSGDENNEPYHAYKPVRNNEGGFIKLGDHDSLPPLNCKNYVLGTIVDGVLLPTSTGNPEYYYVEKNLFKDNIFLEFYRIVNGQEVFFDWIEEVEGGCGELPHGRFPIINLEGNNKPVSGTITYKYESYGFIPNFLNDSLRVKIRIADRELNLSNTVETPVFTLRGVQTNPQ